jgi:hypothetical protein
LGTPPVPTSTLQVGPSKHTISVRVDLSGIAVDGDDKDVVKQLVDLEGDTIKIPAYSKILYAMAVPYQLSNESTMNLTLNYSTDATTARGVVLANDEEIIGAAVDGLQVQADPSGSGTSLDILLGSGATAKYPYYIEGAYIDPSSTKGWVGSSDVYLYIIEGSGNGGTTPSQGQVDIIIEYVGVD